MSVSRDGDGQAGSNAGDLPGEGTMREAYRAAASLSDHLMEEASPGTTRFLRQTQVVVVTGKYDQGEGVLDLCEIPCTRVHAQATDALRLDPDQVLFVNCPGKLPEKGVARVRDFVERGGLLVTTDWALTHVVEKAFPGFIEYNHTPTKDDVVRVVFEQVQDTFLEGLLDPDEDPLWWLEGSSYPIRVLHPSVRTLVSSQEMKTKYGEAPIVCAFEVGAGKVYHMTSHFFLQRTETRTKRQQQGGTDYLAAKGVPEGTLSVSAVAAATSANVGELQSAYTSARAVKNMILEQAKRSTARRS